MNESLKKTLQSKEAEEYKALSPEEQLALANKNQKQLKETLKNLKSHKEDVNKTLSPEQQLELATKTQEQIKESIAKIIDSNK